MIFLLLPTSYLCFPKRQQTKALLEAMKNNLLQITVLAFLFLLFNHPSRYKPEVLVLNHQAIPKLPAFLKSDTAWVDSVMDKLSLEERIGQMLMVQAYSNRDESHTKEVQRIIDRYQVGGVIFFQGEAGQQVKMTNKFQQTSEIPLLIAIDGEVGLGMRLKNVITYPRHMELGAIQDNRLIYQMGWDIAAQMKRMGVHLNFAPVADINNNPENPVINTRSFGENREHVTAKVIMLMKGMQDNGLLVTAKHFPGHGDTDSDSHHTLPVIPHSLERLDSIELYPFREAIKEGLSGIMVAHLQVPSLDDREFRPTTLSRPVITNLLKNKMEFHGLIVTDALNMKGASDHYETGELEVEAVKAGNDILLMPGDIGRAIAAIKRAVRKGDILAEEIDESCRKILRAKYWAGLHDFKPIQADSLDNQLNKKAYKHHYRELIAHAITLVKNRESVLPLHNLQKVNLATVSIGISADRSFLNTSDLYLEGDHFTLSPVAYPDEQSKVLQQLSEYNTIIINIYETSSYASQRFGITDETVRFIDNLDTTATLILNLAGFPYALSRFSKLNHLDALILSFTDDPLHQSLTAQGIFGGISFQGILPVTVTPFGRMGDGVSSSGEIRLAYADPFDAGLNSDTLEKIGTIIQEAIGNKAIPGCQVLVAREGKVVFHRAYGHHTYLRRKAVQLSDLYDLASVTKIVATLPALMKLRERGGFHEDSLLKAYLKLPDSSNKGDLLISDVLTHQAGLQSWIPFYYKTLEPLDTSQNLVSSHWSHTYPLRIGNLAYANRNVKYLDGVFQKEYSPVFPIQVASDFYMHSDWRDSVYQEVYHSRLLSPEYRYSDLGYYMLQQVIERTTDTLLFPYVWYNFYAQMGARTMGYLPLNRFHENRIVPTENDMFFRRQLLRGHVHDPGAAMLGGIAGHAGIFSNANDLAKMMQMYLNGGWYGEKRYLDSTTIVRYTSCFNCEQENRRGLGFDRPVMDEPDAGPACDSASVASYGHTGFTGTIAWVDPEYDLVYVFLSNRIHPDQGNDKLIETNVRTRIQQVIYNAVLNKATNTNEYETITH